MCNKKIKKKSLFKPKNITYYFTSTDFTPQGKNSYAHSPQSI